MFYGRSLELIYVELQKFCTCCTTCLRVRAKLRVMSNSLLLYKLQPTGLICLWDSQARILQQTYRGYHKTKMKTEIRFTLIHSSLSCSELKHEQQKIKVKKKRILMSYTWCIKLCFYVIPTL